MPFAHILTIVVFLALLFGLAWPLGQYMAKVLQGESCLLSRVLGPLERLLYRVCGVKPQEEMDWKAYALAMFLFSMAGVVILYLLQRAQGWLPLNPDGMSAVEPGLAFNTAMSFVTNTNWQAYGGESTMSYLTQMLGSRCTTSCPRPRAWPCWPRSSAGSPGARRATWATSGSI